MSDPKTSIAAYVASCASFFLGWMASNAALIGVLCAVGTFLVNWYYKHRHLKVVEKAASSPFPRLDTE